MKYFVYTNTECPSFDSLDEAIAKYNATEMNKLRDDVFLGISSDEVTMTSGFCFDVIHKFFKENVLINDYLNHDEDEIKKAVKQIKESLFIRYQWTHEILGGALIDYEGRYPFPNLYEDVTVEEWKEAYIQTLKNDNILYSMGWHDNTKETYEKYGWQYPKVASYVEYINAPVINKDGHRCEPDMDPRLYLYMLGKKISIPEKEM